MELKEKIEFVEKLKNEQNNLKAELAEAEKNNNNDEVKRLNLEINNIVSKIKEVNETFQHQMEERPEEEKIKEEALDFLNKGKNIEDKIAEYESLLNKDNLSSQDKEQIEEKLEKLKFNKNRLKGEIYSVALEKSGLKYNDGEISSMAVVKKYISNVEKLKKEKQELENQKAKHIEIIEQRKSEMLVQFDIAVEKYKSMLDSGKISFDLYKKRITNMKEAKEKDAEMLDKSLEEFDIKIKENEEKIAETEKYIEESQEKFKIYDEYDKVYHELFGEPLDKFAKERYEAIQNELSEVNSKEENKEKAEPDLNKTSNVESVPIDNLSKNDKKVTNEQQGVVIQTVKELENQEPEELPKELLVTSKTMFNQLYKKLSRGTISNNELDALTKVLENKENYDKYGITTGLVFNKARRILKFQGSNMFNNIDGFLKNSYEFSESIRFSTQIENENVLNHDILNSWKNISDEKVFENSKFSVEEYIAQIEKYKSDGNELNEKQEQIYKEAMNVKEKLLNYKNAVKSNIEVTKQRGISNSFIYNAFKDRFRKNEKTQLPQAEEHSKSAEVVGATRVIDLSSMVKNDFAEEVAKPKEVTERTREGRLER